MPSENLKSGDEKDEERRREQKKDIKWRERMKRKAGNGMLIPLE